MTLYAILEASIDIPNYSTISVVPSVFSLSAVEIGLQLINTCEVLFSESFIWKYKCKAQQNASWKGYLLSPQTNGKKS